MPDVWNMIASVATAIAVGVTALQVWLATAQEKTEFEDSLVKEYRELLGQLAPDVLLQNPNADSSARDALPKFFRYFDLCNEQVFLRQKDRVRRDTWIEWEAGIRANLSRPGFRDAWEIVKQETNSFAELRCLEVCKFDPRSKGWGKAVKTVEREMEKLAATRQQTTQSKPPACTVQDPRTA